MMSALRTGNRNKFGAVPTVVDGIRFHSKKEAKRYCDLRQLERIGEIANLRLQPRYPLVVEGIKVCTYVGDFAYDERDGREVTEDTKGYQTPEFKLKAKLFSALHGREIRLT